MSTLSKPIPPLYTVYILRSTVRNASLYIGSTPNPPRRLKQHNGDVKGGAARTAKSKLRPWEMVGLVSGFPGMVAALKFEWALTNPHVSLHIPSTSRISAAAGRKRNGHPKRPRHTLTSILSNLHLLLRVPSFSRWPLNLHFFVPEVHEAWNKWCTTVDEPLRDTIQVLTDFNPARTNQGDSESSDTENEVEQLWGIHALPLDYAPMKTYVMKTQSIYDFEREGDCIVCQEQLDPGKGLYATCSNIDCEGTGHISCWSRHLLGKEADEDIIPISGRCPRCKGEVVWGDLMKEMSLRIRGPKEVEKLLKKPRKRKTQAESNI
ncbi:Structure-specific endonuclease subunit SLX1 [Daldinia childiae]|uniref:Structure-specific endonuclease subunit SLX1 n=1 Tax=Daldinia childiae TaxID=326645 RepID=UPI001445981A|nr:Structure-specific endonuclease subunit SLX1 [Daldinia childiae]KAF3056435.1 Structure-specific endonuclease subunit SLX1 [Daldinia childiae]